MEQEVLKKVNEGQASFKDLFHLADEAGNRNGLISIDEFIRLVGRLGIKISEERAIEIFTSVKRFYDPKLD